MQCIVSFHRSRLVTVLGQSVLSLSVSWVQAKACLLRVVCASMGASRCSYTACIYSTVLSILKKIQGIRCIYGITSCLGSPCSLITPILCGSHARWRLLHATSILRRKLCVRLNSVTCCCAPRWSGISFQHLYCLRGRHMMLVQESLWCIWAAGGYSLCSC